MDKIVINVVGQTDLDSTIKKLNELGVVDDKNAKSFQQNNKNNQKSIDDTSNKLGSFNNVLGKIGGAMAGAFAVSSLINFGKQILDVTSKFQKFEAVLTNTLGSSSAAQKALKQIQEFAQVTPFSVEELTQSYVKLANMGFKPTADEMRKLGDLASSTGKSFDQLSEAILDAKSFEFERLKEFGIRAKKTGENVEFTFKGVTTTVKATDKAVQDYILSLGDLQGVSGSMAAISKTLEGRLSNLGDSFDQLLLTIGKSGSSGIAAGIGVLTEGLNELTNALQDKPSLFDEIKEAFIGMFRPFKDAFLAVKGLVSNFVDLNKSGSGVKITLNVIGFALKAITTPLKLTIQGFVTLAHSLDTVVKLGKNAINLFKGKPFEDVGIGKLKEDFNNFVKILTFTDGEFKHVTETVVAGSEDQADAIDEVTESVVKLTKEQEKALKKWQEMRAKPMAGDIDVRLKNEDVVFEKQKTRKEEIDEFFKSKEKEIDEWKRKKQEEEDEALLKKEQEKIDKIIAMRKAAEEQAKQFALDTINTILESSIEASQIRVDNQIEKINEAADNEIKALERRNKNGLVSDEELRVKKEAIQEKARQKEKVLRQQQAQKEKELALFKIAIDTAVNAVKAFGTAGPVGVALAIATGALQAAVVSSRPLPGFKKGGFTGQGNPNETAGIVHKSEFVMPADKTTKYRKELDAMYKGDFRLPIMRKDTLDDARNESMADNIYKSLALHGQFDDRNLIRAITNNKDVKLKNTGELASLIANKIADRNNENSLFA